jgi:hypothetical protein
MPVISSCYTVGGSFDLPWWCRPVVIALEFERSPARYHRLCLNKEEARNGWNLEIKRLANEIAGIDIEKQFLPWVIEICAGGPRRVPPAPSDNPRDGLNFLVTTLRSLGTLPP